MFCPNCGTQNEDTAAFCGSCGTKLTPDMAAQPQMGTQQAQAGVAQPQQAQAGAQQAQPFVNGQQPVQAAPRKPLSKNAITGIIAAAAAVVVLIIFIIAGSVLSSPERVVKKYFKAQMEGKWDKVYDCVDLPSGDFVSKDAMKAARQDADTTDITNFEVTEKDGDSAISKTYTVTYYVSGSSKRTMTVELVKSGKVLLFWNGYKVSSDDVVVKNIRLIVNNDGTLYVDGTKVDDKYLDTSLESTTYKTYQIDYLMCGKHTFKTVSDIYEDEEKDYTITYDNESYSMIASTVKESAVADRKTAAVNDLQTLIQAGVARKDFGDVESMFYTENSTKLSNAKKKYENFRDNTRNSSGYGVTSASVNSATASDSSTGTTEGMPYIKISVKFELSLTGQNSALSSQKTSTRTYTDTITYVYKDGGWKVYEISMSSLSV